MTLTFVNVEIPPFAIYHYFHFKCSCTQVIMHHQMTVCPNLYVLAKCLPCSNINIYLFRIIRIMKGMMMKTMNIKRIITKSCPSVNQLSLLPCVMNMFVMMMSLSLVFCSPPLLCPPPPSPQLVLQES